MEMKARVLSEPILHLLLFVSGIIVRDAVDVHPPGRALVNRSQEFEKLLMPMPRHALANHDTFQNIESGEQCGRAITFIIMRHGSGAALLHRQARLGTIERLNLAFLINAKYQRVLRWVHIKTHDIVEFRYEIRVVG